LQEGAVTLLEDFSLNVYQTRKMVELLSSLGLAGQGVLIVLSEADVRVERSARNLPQVDVIRAVGLNVYDVLRHSKLVMTRAAVEVISERLRAGSSGERTS